MAKFCPIWSHWMYFTLNHRQLLFTTRHPAAQTSSFWEKIKVGGKKFYAMKSAHLVILKMIAKGSACNQEILFFICKFQTLFGIPDTILIQHQQFLLKKEPFKKRWYQHLVTFLETSGRCSYEMLTWLPAIFDQI